MVIRAAKCKYFSTQIASEDNRPATLFNLLLGKEDTEVYMKERVEESDFLTDKIAWIRSHLGAGMIADLVETPGVASCPIICEQFDPVAAEEIDLGNMCATTVF